MVGGEGGGWEEIYKRGFSLGYPRKDEYVNQLLNFQNNCGDSALMLASKEGSLKSVKVLLAALGGYAINLESQNCSCFVRK